ncbi:transposase insK for insertion sequence element IS150 [Paenibacillus terrae HPL-003]|uniref:Transposase insK for insertion sequence element IS150 n=1 Tax=Paenibacillus terrae (strain HPL-003) TaxID=985665 RepID=G7W1Y1_PAETH|nr:IS3 family transposase [Paenibacillus terrae]AET59161.1 transposase insK for insertion sequence element IS150 [Paenibacillus terrae HPL-003]
MNAVPQGKKFALIQDLMSNGYNIVLLCRLAQVSRSGFYKWMKRQTFISPKQREDETMKLKIGACHEKMKGILSYRRIQVWLERTYGIHVNHKRVQKLMGELGIRAVIRRKRLYYGKREAYVLSGNHLNREFIANQTNQKWVTYITKSHVQRTKALSLRHQRSLQ